MFGNLMMVGGLIAVFWIGCFAFYLYTSRQQKSIANEIDKVRQHLDDGSED